MPNPYKPKDKVTVGDLVGVVVAKRLTEARSSERAGDLLGTIVALSKAIFSQPKNARLYALRGECYIKLTDFQSALLSYRKALRLEPGNVQYKSRVAGLCYVKGNLCAEDCEWDAALAAYDEACRLEPRCYDYMMGRIQVQIHHRQYKNALDGLGVLLAAKPSYVPALLRRAKLLLDSREIERAKSDIDRARSLDPEGVQVARVEETFQSMARTLANEAAGHLLSGDLQKAILAVTDSLRIGPSSLAYRLRATAFRRNNRFSLAIADLTAGIDHVQDELKRLGEEPELKAPLRAELAKCEEQMAATLNDVGTNLLKMGKLQEAITCFTKAISRDKTKSRYHLNLSECYRRLHRLDKALASSETGLAIARANSRMNAGELRECKQQVACLRHERGRRKFNSSYYRQAEKEYTAAIALYPDSAAIYFSRGEALLQMAKFVEAYMDFKRALERDSSLKAARERMEWVRSKIDPAAMGRRKSKPGRG